MNHSSAVRLYGALHAKTVQQICTTRNFQLTFSRTLEINSEPHVPHQLAPPLKEETCILFEHGHVHKRTVNRIYGLKIIISYSYLSSAMFMIFSVTRNILHVISSTATKPWVSPSCTCQGTVILSGSRGSPCRFESWPKPVATHVLKASAAQAPFCERYLPNGSKPDVFKNDRKSFTFLVICQTKQHMKNRKQCP